ncbi:MAG: YibE/F family protein [Bacteroidales bacterium]|nr:YibE/F family protein [Bacteroidales bacterium]
MRLGNISRRNLIFVAVSCVLILAMALMPTGYENPSLTEDTFYQKAEVLEVDNSGLQTISVVTIGNQKLKIKILGGQFDGNVLQAENVLNGHKNIDKIFAPGDMALAVIKTDHAHDKILSIRAQDHYRSGIELILAAVFVIALLAFAGFTGVKAIVSFVFTALCFWKVLLPLLLDGWAPVPLGLGVSFATAAVVILLVSGVGRKGLTALTGCFCGVAFTAVVATISSHWFKIPGTVQDYSEALIYSGFQLDLSGIFLASVFISASGALMDVSTDIAASIDELHSRMPGLSARELMKSGFKIARPVIGSTTTTLLFAYSGGFIFAFMAFMSKGMPFEYIVNTPFISAEILHTIVGSLGLVLTAPITAVVGGLIYGNMEHR